MPAPTRQYLVEAVLGRGAFGTVYRARFEGERGFSKLVALKVLNAQVLDLEEVARRLRDEARMMAQRLDSTGWPVIQSRNRPRGLEFLKKLSPDLQIILLEDAFQTGGLARHVDLVILDSWLVDSRGGQSILQPLTGSVFPFGPWRETAGGADRASALLVESEAELPEVSFHGQPVFSFRRFVELRHVSGPAVGTEARNCALVSGIARPEKFEAAALELLDQPAVLSLRCRDHVNYGQSLVQTILKEMDETGAETLLTTAKDWVKLSGVWNDSRPVMVLDMELKWAKKDAFNHWLVERVL